MSKSPKFHFTPESSASSVTNTEKKENRIFFYNLISLSTVSTGFFLYLLSPLGSKNQIRDIQSIPSPPTVTSQFVSLKPFVVRLKTAKGFRLSHIQVTLQTTPSPALKEEIKNSTTAIQDHLLFILSDTQSTVFMNPKQLAQLQKSITEHLNLFLVEGKITDINLEQTFLHP